MTLEDIIRRVDKILVDEFELDPADVVPSALIREDLDLDSLDGVDLLIALEKVFGFRIEDSVLREVRTVAEIHKFVREYHEKQQASPVPDVVEVVPLEGVAADPNL